MHWKYDGYIRWLRGSAYMSNVSLTILKMIFVTGLGTQYTTRRDFLIDCLDDEFNLQLASARNGVWEGCDYFLASAKPSGKQMSEKWDRKTMFSFVPPTSGMFIWVRGLPLHSLPLTDSGLDQVAP
jgi:aromatic amino acid aminotransferase I / 2-aminoadipate transaminase